jgi:exodeoxyribonuclease-5
MSITLSPDQEAALSTIQDWLSSDSPTQLTLGGYAGTGKTTILGHLVDNNPELRIAVVTLTGKAALVLSRSIHADNARISTIHRFMYKPILSATNRLIGWQWQPEASRENNFNGIPAFDLIINDEASMTTESLYLPMGEYKKPMLFVGDHGQLPPINSKLNLMEAPEIRLEKIHRQAEHNPIIRLATDIREGRQPRTYSSTVRVIKGYDELKDITKDFLSGVSDNLIITAKNNDRVQANKRIRANLGFDSETPQPGDLLICLKNNYKQGLFNGQIVKLREIEDYHSRAYIGLIETDDGLEIELPISKAGFNVPKLSTTVEVSGTLFDYGYAVTCHKAQGSQAKRVFVLGRGFGTEDEKRRWLYTAVTRAQEEVYLLS